MSTSFHTLVIGGGAAGFFAAIHAAAGGHRRVLIAEKSTKLLSKVLVSGGGRCNVTHHCPHAAQLVKHYPRGGKMLRKAFERFGTRQTMEWFQERGVPLKIEEDGRVFPVSDNSQSIADALLTAAQQAGVKVRTSAEVLEVEVLGNKKFAVKLKGGEVVHTGDVIITSGGHPKREAYNFIERLGIDLVDPIPSLFTFNVPGSDLKELMGLSVHKGEVLVPGTDWRERGPVLITHWGFSAPAVLKLSARAAVYFHQKAYRFPLLVNFAGKSEAEMLDWFREEKLIHPKRRLAKHPPSGIPQRLWESICLKAGIEETQVLADLSAKAMNRLVEFSIRSPYQVQGKTTFKEEFVTCGGVALSEIDTLTFMSKKYPGLYFAGEVLDVDGFTGGFNFQHAWTSGYLAGMHAASHEN